MPSPENYQKMDCAVRHNGAHCTCGYELRACMNKIMRLAKELEKETRHLAEIRKRETNGNTSTCSL